MHFDIFFRIIANLFFLFYSDEEEEEEKQKRQVSKPKNRGKSKNIHANDTVEVDELNDLMEMNNSFLKKKNCTTRRKKTIISARVSTSKKLEKKGRRIRMLEDSSSDDEKPARKVEISDGDGGNSERGASDGSSCENQENEDPLQSAEKEVENIDNTYDYNDSFIDDNSRSGHNFLFFTFQFWASTSFEAIPCVAVAKHLPPWKNLCYYRRNFKDIQKQ